MHTCCSTYRYFWEPTVCLWSATEKPKRLPALLDSLRTGKRSSMLKPPHRGGAQSQHSHSKEEKEKEQLLRCGAMAEVRRCDR